MEKKKIDKRIKVIESTVKEDFEKEVDALLSSGWEIDKTDIVYSAFNEYPIIQWAAILILRK